MRGDGWLQKLLYVLMVLLGSYIIYKGAGLLQKSSAVREALDTGTVQRSLEDAAADTWMPGYTAVVGEKDEGGWIAGWMRQAVPVYSYLAENAGRQQDKPGTDTEDSQSGAESQTSAGNEGKMQGAQQETAALPSENSENHVEEQETQGDAEQSVGEQGISEENAGVSETERLSEETVRTPETGGLPGETQIPPEETAETEAVKEVLGTTISDEVLAQISDYEYLLQNYYTVDAGTTADEELLDASVLLEKELGIERNPEVPQILIYHTHSQEEFADSVPGDASMTIVGMGEVLAEELRSYGYQVIHDTGVYDLVDGVLDRSAAYDYARASVQKILDEHPTIEVIIDLHRDGVEGHKFVTEIDGKPTSMIMFFNGISRNSADEPLTYLANPYIAENLAFSLQLELLAREQYPGFTRNIYLKAERFNLHLRPRSLLIEAGTQLNTVEEERNAMAPLAALLAEVLS